jgi:2'-5' RNA ligase
MAINIPEQIKEHIWQVFSEKIPKQEMKRVEKQNLHVTLLFLGYLHENYVKELEEKLKPIEKLRCFEITLSTIGCFGSRVLWLGVTKNAQRIVELHDEICRLLGISDERFSAHVTLARNKRLSGREFANVVEQLKKEQFEESFLVKSVDIMESILTSSGPIYKKLAEIRLSI